jgi:hypothetical protein
MCFLTALTLAIISTVSLAPIGDEAGKIKVSRHLKPIACSTETTRTHSQRTHSAHSVREELIRDLNDISSLLFFVPLFDFRSLFNFLNSNYF